MAEAKRLPIPAEIADAIAYDPVTGVLSWKIAAAGITMGAVAGTKTRTGYLTLKFRGQTYAAHRVAWFLAKGEQPPELIDHHDMDRSHNSLSNLREATRSLNAANAPARKGMKGVHFSKRHKKYVAKIRVNGVTHHIGYFPTEETAHHAYQGAAFQHFGEFARF